MSFIEIIPDAEIDATIRQMYERQASFWGFVPNYAKVFCYRPEVMGLWAALQLGIKKSMGRRRFELVTFAAAVELRSTLCSLAHGKHLSEYLSMDEVKAIAGGELPTSMSAEEIEIVRFARKVARDASSTTQDDVARLKNAGLTDADIFDISAAAGARAFWTKVVESLGVTAEPSLLDLDEDFKQAMTVGRPIDP